MFFENALSWNFPAPILITGRFASWLGFEIHSPPPFLKGKSEENDWFV